MVSLRIHKQNPTSESGQTVNADRRKLFGLAAMLALLPFAKSALASTPSKGKVMKPEIIRVEPYSTWLEKYNAPTSTVARANGFVFVTGMPPYDPETGEVVKNASIARQTELVLDQMKAFLEAAGSDLEHCVKVIVYSRSTEKFAEINEVYRRYFPKNPPPRMFVNVAGHPADFDIEIDCTAVVRN